MSTLTQRAYTMQKSLYNFSSYAGGMNLRTYQTEPGDAIVNSVINELGLTFVLMLSRQAGKDELLCHLKMYLMQRFQHRDVEIVEFNPTYKPQTIRARLRLETRLQSNVLTANKWKKHADFIRMIGQAKTSFLSGDGRANVVGATASLLLIMNEAQDITANIYDGKASPMAASTNATRVLVGTAWTTHNLLHRELNAAKELEKIDGIRRTFIYDADDVTKANPNYGKFVETEIQRLGRQHPLIKTQYFNETIDAQAGMFNPTRRALMKGDQPAQDEPIAGHTYAFLMDVAGQDEARLLADDDAPLENPGRDALALSIVDVDISNLAEDLAPTYRVIKRLSWVGENHVKVFKQITTLWSLWNPLHMVIDKTGVGEGLYGMMFHKYDEKVIGYHFTAKAKSELGYRYIAIIETGRFKDCEPSATVDLQYQNIEQEILPGPTKTMRWSVPDGTRDNTTGELIHDDFVIADSLTGELDQLEWLIQTESTIIPRDILKEIDNSND